MHVVGPQKPNDHFPPEGVKEYYFDDTISPPPPFPPFPGFRTKPSLFSFARGSNNLLMKIFGRRRKHRPLRPFPSSPFPGMGGVFSPNPGYLVRQNFWVAG